MKALLVVFLLAFGWSLLPAQTSQIVYKNKNKRYYDEYSLFVGYDIPFTDKSFKYLKYQGDLATGVGFHKFWDWIGVSADINMAKSRMSSSFQTPMNIYNSIQDTIKYISSYSSDNDKLQKLFLGAGPSFKYQSKNNRFVIDLSLMAGLGRVQKGEFVQFGDDVQDPQNPWRYGINYHSGFVKQSTFATKGTLRFSLQFLNDTSLFLGAYYETFYNAKEGGDNFLLNSYFTGQVNGRQYYVEPEVGQLDQPLNGTTSYIPGVNLVRNEAKQNRKSFNLSSVGIIGGFSFLVFKSKVVKRCPSGYTLCPKDNLCYNTPNCGEVVMENSTIKVVTKEKDSNITLGGVNIELVNTDNNTTIAKGVTNSQGQYEFTKVPPGNYAISVVQSDAQFNKENVTKNEFENTSSISKTLYKIGESYVINGVATDCKDNTALGNVMIKATNLKDQSVINTTTNSDGRYSLKLPGAGLYRIETQKENYYSEPTDISVSATDNNQNFCLQVLDCNSSIKFKNLLFGLDDYHLTPNSTAELDNLVNYLNKNPNIKIEVGSHTDSRGSNAYNQKLSQQRAEETVKYLESKGISSSRLISKGYGESKLLNNCSDGVSCTEEEHAINRRTEFKVVCD